MLSFPRKRVATATCRGENPEMFIVLNCQDNLKWNKKCHSGECVMPQLLAGIRIQEIENICILDRIKHRFSPKEKNIIARGPTLG